METIISHLWLILLNIDPNGWLKMESLEIAFEARLGYHDSPKMAYHSTFGLNYVQCGLRDENFVNSCTKTHEKV